MSFSRRRHSLFFQIMAGFLVLAFITILLTGFICLFLFQRFAVQRNLYELSSSIATVSGVVRSLEEESVAPEDSQILELRMLTNASLLFWNANTHVLHLSDSEILSSTASLSPADTELVSRVLAGEELSGVFRLDLFGGKVMLCGSRVNRSDGVLLGALLLARRVSNIYTYSSNFFFPLSFGAFFAILVTLLTSWYFARMISRPIVILESAAKHARDNSHALVDLTGPAEVENLGSALNDLSQRLKQSIDSIAEERSRLEQVLAGVGEGLVAVDEGGRVIYHNEAAREFFCCPQAGPLCGKAAEDVLELLSRAVAQSEQRNVGWQLPDGRVVAAVVRPIRDDGGKVRGAVALLRDVSEAQRLEQMRRDYIANISHELRTPLTGIRGMVEPLLDGVIDGEEAKQSSYRIIYQETVRLQKLIGDMLDMSRLQSGHIQLDLEPVEIASMLRAACQRLAGQAAEAGVKLETDAAGEPFWCLGDEDRVMQVLIILLDNALRFTPSGGEVYLFARSEGDWIAFGLRDTGCGIDPKDMPYIWERFFKADRSHSKGGTGLGLAIAKLAVEHMQGSIEAESSPGRGAIFTVRLRAQEIPEA